MINDLYPGKRKRQNVYVVLLLRPFNRILGNEKKKKKQKSWTYHVSSAMLHCVHTYDLQKSVDYHVSSAILDCAHVPPTERVDLLSLQCYTALFMYHLQKLWTHDGISAIAILH